MRDTARVLGHVRGGQRRSPRAADEDELRRSDPRADRLQVGDLAGDGVTGGVGQPLGASGAELVASACATVALAGESVQALSDERARLARELHDAVGHAVTVMVTHAGAARLVLGGGHPEIRASLEQIEDVGRSAMHDLDRTLGLLEADPAVPDLDASVRRLVATLPAHLRAETAVAADLGEVGGPAAQAVHRVVQESLTNVVRHASASSVRVRLLRDREDIVVEVTDDGSAPGPPRPGRGLTGMRDRVQRLGGTCRAGPDASGGWRVDARIPAGAP
ncbi:MAG TPA: histidine kinase [Spirillospora sp.]|nr:histidine kinase [Spirillospora sp.]